MADELSIQQKQSSATPYVTTGGALGALGAGGTAYYYSRPKYGSWEDIISDSKDEATFNGKKYEGIDKAVKDEIKNVAANAENEAGEKYDKMMNEYIEANKGGTVKESENLKKLLKAQEDAERVLAEKKAELLKAETDALKSKNSRPVLDFNTVEGINKKIAKDIEANPTLGTAEINAKKQAYIDAAINGIKQTIKKQEEKLAQHKAHLKEIENEINDVLKNGKAESIINKYNVRMSDLSKGKKVPVGNIDKKTGKWIVEDFIVAKTPEQKNRAKQYADGVLKEDLRKLFPKLEAEGNEKLTRNALEQAKFVLQNMIDNRINADHSIDNLVNKVAKKYSDAKLAFDTARPYDIVSVAKEYTKDNKQLADLINAYESESNPKIKNSMLRRMADQVEFNLKNDAKNLADKLGKVNEQIIVNEQLIAMKQEGISACAPIGRKLEFLSKEEYWKMYEEAKNCDESFLKKQLEALRDEKNSLTTRHATATGRLKTIAETNDKYDKLKLEFEQAKKNVEAIVGEEGAYAKDGKLLNKDGKVYTIKKTKFTLPETVELPKDDKTNAFEQRISNIKAKLEPVKLSDAEIAKQAEEAVLKNEAYTKQAEVVENAKKAVNKEKANLPKVEGKDPEVLKKEFIKKEGERTAFVKKEAEEAMKAVKEKHKGLLDETRMKFFESGKSWKIAGAAAIGAVVLGALGKLFAPSREV